MHVYKREFSVSEGNYFFLPAAEPSACFEIQFPPEGKITRLIVKQAADDDLAADFTVDLYDREVCDTVLSGSSVSAGDQDTMTAELAKIIPTQFAAAGDAMELRSGHGYSYRNREGSYTVPVRKVYLNIAPDSVVNESRWEVAIECEVGNESN